MIFLLGIFGVIVIALIFRNREGERRHAERLKAMELGIPVPPAAIEPQHRRKIALSMGILSLTLALAFGALSALGFVMHEPGHGSGEAGELLIPTIILACLGIGFIVIHIVNRRGNGNGNGH